ncbi:MAG: squalene synthase HpnC [Acidobacteria bacterium]|nr:squalene synthase HpnC [Acidobacteriota bacterium]
MARAHYENFPVASRLLPRRLRPHVAAVYAFARTADDIADEPGREPGERLALLEGYRERLISRQAKPSPVAIPSRRPLPPPDSGVPPPDAFFPALHDTIDRFDLPVSLFTDLLSAFEQDVTTNRYDTWEQVLDYCRRSANPVGRIVLRLSGYRSDALDEASDAVCTALQLTNFWQDLAVDWSRGRLYVPEEAWRAHGASLADLDRRAWTPAWRSTLVACGVRTRALFDRGRVVCDGVGGRLRFELRATWHGGMRILDRLEQGGYDVFRARPSLGIADGMVIACRTLAWRVP